MWDRRYTEKHYTEGLATQNRNLFSEHNVQNVPLVKPEKAFVPPLHINLWLMKNSAKSRGRYPYLRSKFPNLSDAKVKRGIFVGPQITKVMLD